MQMKKMSFFLIGALLLLITACVPVASPIPQTGDGQTPTAENPLAGTQWALVSIGETGAETPVVEGSAPTIAFEADGQASGMGGCNSFGTNYTLQDDSLSFEPVVSTLIACPDPAIMQQETEYFDALQNASRFELSGDQLTIFSDGQVLNFERS